eukprot:1300113-Amphidinium_carterae.2
MQLWNCCIVWLKFACVSLIVLCSGVCCVAGARGVFGQGACAVPAGRSPDGVDGIAVAGGKTGADPCAMRFGRREERLGLGGAVLLVCCVLASDRASL